jgi:hypothetical protein
VYTPLDDHTIYIDGTLSDEVVAAHDYVYNSFIAAAADFLDGTEARPMRVLIAPWVYWIDDPDDPVAAGTAGRPLFGMTINKTWLRWEGLTKDPANVVICADRGAGVGATGNFTNFDIIGDGLYLQDLTVANYCSVDLEYPLNPALNRPKRTAARPQAQLIRYDGDKAIARRVRFVSRLNLAPIDGGPFAIDRSERVLYDTCHFESTDDALNGGTAVYLNCDFDFYGWKPIYYMIGTVFLNCDFRSHLPDGVKQYITKYYTGSSAVIDGRFVSDGPNLSIGWVENPLPSMRSYQYNVTVNGQPALMSTEVPGVSVRLEEYPNLLKAYKFTYNGETIYNTYNLLRGSDNWDPMNIREKVEAASTPALNLGKLPVWMTASVDNPIIETSGAIPSAVTDYVIDGGTDAELAASAGRITWSVLPPTPPVSYLTFHENPNRRVLNAYNGGYANASVVVEAVSELGIHAAAAVLIKPGQLSAPAFNVPPSITIAAGKAVAEYEIVLPDPAVDDQSEISWYRCTDGIGTNSQLVAVTRTITEIVTRDGTEILPTPIYLSAKEYTLSQGDVGYYLKAVVAPRHSVSPAGSPQEAFYGPINSSDVVNINRYTTDFSTFPTARQNNLIPGFFTLSAYRYPNGTQPSGAFATNSTNMASNYTPGAGEYWHYDFNVHDDASNRHWGLTSGSSRGSNLIYTPSAGIYGDMTLTLIAAPEKMEGQGFGGQGQGMDILIKYNSVTQSGYGVRLHRISASSSGIVVNLIKVENEVVTYLTNLGDHTMGAASELVSAYLADCTIVVKLAGTTLSATLNTTAAQEPSRHTKPDGTTLYTHSVNLSTTIVPSTDGGIQILHYGDRGTDGATVLRSMDIQWQ